MQIHQLSDLDSHPVFFDDGYRIWTESFQPYTGSDYNTQAITPAMAAKYEGDFYGLLDALGVAKIYHYHVMIFNGYRHSGDFEGVATEVKIPTHHMTNTLRTMYNTFKG